MKTKSKQFVLEIGRLALTESPSFIRIDGYRPLFPRMRNRLAGYLWWKVAHRPGDIVQVNAIAGYQWAGCCMIVTEPADENGMTAGIVHGPSPEGSVAIEARFPSQYLHRVGRSRIGMLLEAAGMRDGERK